MEGALEQGAAAGAADGEARAAVADCGRFGKQSSLERLATVGFSTVRLKLHVYWNPKVPEKEVAAAVAGVGAAGSAVDFGSLEQGVGECAGVAEKMGQGCYQAHWPLLRDSQNS